MSAPVWTRNEATASMKIVFYLEPVLFRSNPVFLAPHVRWFGQILRALAITSLDVVILLSTKPLFRAFGRESENGVDVMLRHAVLDPGLALAPFDGSVSRYARDLYDLPDEPARNPYLDARLADELRQADPDLIVCSSENRYVVRNRPDRSLLFFIEKLPLPPWAARGRLYFDPLGHQPLGMLSSQWQGLLAADYTEAELSEGRSLVDEVEHRKKAALEADGVRKVVEQLEPGRSVMMVALQPGDWLSWEGALRTEHRPLDLLLSVAARFPACQILPTFHNDMQVPDDVVSWLHELRPNILNLPLSDCRGNSEKLLGVADHVYTVSSAMGMSALLYGRDLVSDADSYLSAAAVSSDAFRAGRRSRLSYDQRVCIAAFIGCRLGRNVSDMKSLDDYRAHASRLMTTVRAPRAGRRAALTCAGQVSARKFGVLEFSYSGYSHFRAIAESGRPYSVNLGDYIQSLGARKALRDLGIAESDIVYVDRDRLSEYDGYPVDLIMNGVFTPTNFPISPRINPVFFGFSYHPKNIIPSDSLRMFEDSLEYLRGKRIGCRDKATAEVLSSYGLDTYVTGCLSQSFEMRPANGKRHLPALICGIDDPDAEAWLMQTFPDHIRMKNQRRPAAVHPLPSQAIADCRVAAESLVSFYASHVSLVFTGLMHCASPCASLGIPTVVVRRDPDNVRFSEIMEHLPLLASGHLASEFSGDQLRAMATTLNRRQFMLGELARALELHREP